MSPLHAHPSFGLVAILIVSSSPCIQAATLRVPEQYSSIQIAVDAAVDGDRVLVSSGEFGGFSIVDKNIEVASLDGPESTVLRGSSIDSVIRLFDTTSHVHGFTVTYGNADEGGGIRVTGGAPTIDGMLVTGNHGGGIGIFVSGAQVHHNRITGNWGLFGGIEIRSLGCGRLRGSRLATTGGRITSRPIPRSSIRARTKPPASSNATSASARASSTADTGRSWTSRRSSISRNNRSARRLA